jgi:uncharacterized surface protein with fasciclin (FAS1) repeats
MNHSTTKRSLLAGMCAVVATALVAPVAIADASEASSSYGRPTLVGLLLADAKYDNADGFDHWAYDFDIVTEALKLFPDLVAAADDPSSNLTVFLPTDAAFRSLVKSLTGSAPRAEKDVFAAVAGLGVDTVKAVLTYHILPTAVDYKTALKSDGAVLTTLNGATLTVDVKGRWLKTVTLIDNDPDLRDPTVIFPNLRASNGVAHAIDRVLLPIDV